MRVFLSFNSKDGQIAEVIKARLLGLEPDLDIFFSPVSLGSGFWLPKLAEQIRDCDAFLLLFGPAGVGPWQVIEYFEAFDRHAKDRRFTMVPLVFAGATVPGLPFLRQLNWVDLLQATDDRGLSRLLAALHGDEAAQAGAALPLWKAVQPYRGLEAMTEASADYFYGRGAETGLVLDRLATMPDRLSMLIGASGVGKSSIARAGVLSALKAMRWPHAGEAGDATSLRPWPAAFQGSRGSWAFLVIRPGQAPLRALAGAFVRLWQPDNPTDPDRAALVGRWAESLKNGSTSLPDLLDVTQEELERRDSAKPDRILIYLDQAEELYTRGLQGERSEATRFAEQLAATLTDPRLLAFGSMRADYFDRLQADTPLFERYEHVNVPPMRAEQIAEVVAGPARALGVSFENERLCGRIVQAAASEAGQLPLLAYLLTDMWSAMVAHDDGLLRLPLGAIDIGGVLAARAEQFLADNPNEEPWVKRLFTLRLALVSPEGSAVRRTASRSECEPREWALVEQLADYPWRLIVARERDHARGEAVAELAHEALLKAWPRLEAWLRDERDFLVFKAEVEHAERRWRDNGSADGALLTGLDLAGAESWLGRRSLDLSPDVRAFIGQSVSVDRLRKERALRIQRRVSAGFAVAALLLLGIGGWALWERQQALVLTVVAAEDAQRADAEKIRAENNAVLAEAKKAEADENARDARAAEARANENAHRMAVERDRSDTVMASLSTILLGGSSLAEKIEEGVANIKTIAEGGDPGAMTVLGLLYANGAGVKKNNDIGRLWIERAAKMGSNIALETMGRTFLGGIGVERDYGQALTWFRLAAEHGDASGMVYVGLFHQNGWSVDRDYDKAREWYEKAASLGNSVALNNLGYLYQNGFGVPRDYGVALKNFEKAAAAGNNTSMNALGEFYLNGWGVARDYAQARAWYEKAAADNNNAAMNELGRVYQSGWGVPRDYTQARAWYEKAAAAGSNVAVRNLGYLYQSGLGVPKDYAKARDLYERATAAGNTSSPNDLGFMAQYGLGGPPDFIKAREWYEKAAAAGNNVAMHNLGYLYQHGLGMPQDFAKARDWYEKSAAAGNLASFNDVGFLYQNGLGVPQDFVKARDFYEKAAAANSDAAMDNLGWLYQNGMGVPQDYAKARDWYQKGAAAGNTAAMSNLGFLDQSGLGGPQDYARAKEWYEKAAAANNNGAMTALGDLYLNAWGLARDYGKAREWYEKASAQGNSRAMNQLGWLFQNGWGVEKDVAQARAWYEKAAAKGEARSMTHLGDFYRNGWGVPQDEAKAMEWRVKAANAGDADAMAGLGDAYRDGVGVPKDDALAYQWYGKAAAAGNTRAVAALKSYGER